MKDLIEKLLGKSGGKVSSAQMGGEDHRDPNRTQCMTAEILGMPCALGDKYEDLLQEVERELVRKAAEAKIPEVMISEDGQAMGIIKSSDVWKTTISRIDPSDHEHREQIIAWIAMLMGIRMGENKHQPAHFKIDV